jgi:catechol 2,3-dioxygenase-like lactoylglutathione lyase family enzyme
MMYNGINHLAFITRDMNATIRFYRDLLGFPLVSGVGNGALKHYFFQVTPRDAIAFFSYDIAKPMELKPHGMPTRKPLGFDHVSIGVNTKADLFALKDRLEAAGFEVSGPVDHGIGWSIYFYDPNQIPLELTWQNLEIVRPPALADDQPAEAAQEGADPQPGHWPEVTRPTPPEEWRAYPGAGFEIRRVTLKQRRGRAVGE